MLAIKYIYETYKQDVFSYLVSLTHNSTLSEDLVSETFLGAITSLKNFKGKSDIKTWLFSIARHKWYEYLRKNKTTVCFGELAEHYISENFDLDDKIYYKDIEVKILNILDKELPKTKDIVLMRIDGYSFYEIATKHNISESSARVIDFRAKKKLKQKLIKEGVTYE